MVGLDTRLLNKSTFFVDYVLCIAGSNNIGINTPLGLEIRDHMYYILAYS